MAKTQPRGEQILDNTIKLDTPNQDVTGILPAGNGGTGNSTNALNNVLLGNGTGALQTVAPGANGNVLSSNGTTWQSAAPSGGGFNLTTKGDIHGYNTGQARIPVGTDGQVLVADSGNALGVSYQTVNFQTRRNSQVASNPGAATLNFYGMATAPVITSGIAAVNGDDLDGPHVQISSTAVAANVASIASAFTQERGDWDYDVSIKVKLTAQALTTGRMWVGVFSASPAALDLPLVHIAGFRLVTTGAVGSPNWRAITAAGTATQTNIDTGVAGAVSTSYVLRVVSRGHGTAYDFYVNGKFIGTSTTNLPTATTLMGYGVYSTALSTTASQLKLAWISIMQD